MLAAWPSAAAVSHAPDGVTACSPSAADLRTTRQKEHRPAQGRAACGSESIDQ